TVGQMAADLCLSLQRLPDAVRLLGELFERQMAAGDAMRASLTYKKLSRFANPSCEQKMRFAELLEGSNRKLALETYESAFEEFTRQAKTEKSLAVMKKMGARAPARPNFGGFCERSSEGGGGKQAAAPFCRPSPPAQSP